MKAEIKITLKEIVFFVIFDIAITCLVIIPSYLFETIHSGYGVIFILGCLLSQSFIFLFLIDKIFNIKLVK